MIIQFHTAKGITKSKMNLFKLFSKRKTNHDLSKRENEVLQLIAQGKTNEEIAIKLGINEQTVKNHCWHIFPKLGVSNRTEAAIKTIQSTTSNQR